MSSALEILWVEKYRPKRLSEVINQVEVVSRLKKFIEERNMPHLLFAGPPGTGKTTVAHALARDLYGEGYRQYILELNASVTKDTPILARINGNTLRTTFDELGRIYFNSKTIFRYGDGEYAKVNELEVLTYDEHTGRVTWRKATWIIRHRVSKVLRVRIEGGGEIGLTGNHSVMVLDENGEITEKSASDLKPGDYLLSFTTILPGRRKEGIIIEDNGEFRNNDMRGTSTSMHTLSVNAQYDSLKDGRGQFSHLTLISNYPSQHSIIVEKTWDPTATSAQLLGDLMYSNLDGSIEEAFYVKGFGDHYGLPSYVYEFSTNDRRSYITGLRRISSSSGLDNIVRITSASKDFLIDISWLSRITGIESYLSGSDVKLVLEGSMRHVSSGLLPVYPLVRLLEEISRDGFVLNKDDISQLHGVDMISKEKMAEILAGIDESKLTRRQREWLKRLHILALSDLNVLKVVDIEVVNYNDYVYDVSVPGNNMFFAGPVPVLLHNSDERGINVIREKVKEFARSRTPPGIPFKIIILDEADNMTSDAQQALRRLMELYSTSTRFILIANYPSKIIDPIQSRCAFFRFQPLKKEDVVDRLRYIADVEGVDYDLEALETIYEISEGDMRKAINILQAAAALGKVTVDAVFRVVGLAKPREVREMIKLALEGNFMASREMLRKLMIEYGLSGEDVVRQIHKEIFSSELKIPDDLRVIIADYIGEIHYRLVEGSDDDIQLSALLAWLSMIGRKISGA